MTIRKLNTIAVVLSVATLWMGCDSEKVTPDAGVDAAITNDSSTSKSDIATPSDSGADTIVKNDAQIVADVAVQKKGPKEIQGSKLQLWLSADKALTCDASKTPNKVTKWEDQSGQGRHALPQTTGKEPHCGAASADLNNVDLPFFPGKSGDTDEGALKIDLSYLAKSSFTIFVVDRRQSNKAFSYYLGSEVDHPEDTSCVAGVGANGQSTVNKGLGIFMGYRQSDLARFGVWADDCDLRGTIPLFDENNKVVRVMALVYDSNSGKILYVDGVKTDESDDKMGMTAIGQGYLGRGYANVPSLQRDPRYHGEIAEVIIYNAALSDQDRQAVEAYIKDHWKL